MRSAIFAAAFAALVAAAPAPMPQNALPIEDMEADFVVAMAATSNLGPQITATADPVDFVASAAAASAVSDDVTAANTGLLTLATATPTTVAVAEKRQATSTSTTTSTTAASSTCPGATQATGAGPVASPDTASAFLANSVLAASVSAAVAPTGYSNTFTNLNGSSQQIGYLGLYTLNSYNPALCSAKCDKVSTCMAFNIYFERDPQVNPDSNVCPNPPSTTNIKCTLYGYPISGDRATNTGQYRNNFQVVIAGSNGYVKTLPPPSATNFTNIATYGNAAMQAPLDPKYGLDSGNTFILSKTATDPYSPAICAAYCQAQTAYDKQYPGTNNGVSMYKACNYFNQYILMKDGDAQGTVCALYTETWNASYATNTGYWSTDSNNVVHHWTIAESWGYAINSNLVDGGNVPYSS